MQKVAIIDYGSGNLRSVAKAVEAVSSNKESIYIATKATDIADASHIILPGVGAFADCMSGLSSIPDMIDTLREQVLSRGKPFLGICVGMQMLADYGVEFGKHKGLGWIKGEIVKIEPEDSNLKIPHMGWNELIITKDITLLRGIKSGEHVYFVHSYQMLTDTDNIAAYTDYGSKICAAVAKDNIMGVQFHPEKSQSAGLKILGNFLSNL